MDYMAMLGNLLSGKNNKFPNTGMEGGNSLTKIPMGMQETYNPDGGGFNNLRSGSGAEQIPTGFQNEYIAPEDESNFDFSKVKFGEDVIDTFNPDIPERQPSAIEEPIQPVLMGRGEVAPISPLFGKQSLEQLNLDEQERLKMAQVLRGY